MKGDNNRTRAQKAIRPMSGRPCAVLVHEEFVDGEWVARRHFTLPMSSLPTLIAELAAISAEQFKATEARGKARRLEMESIERAQNRGDDAAA